MWVRKWLPIIEHLTNHENEIRTKILAVKILLYQEIKKLRKWFIIQSRFHFKIKYLIINCPFQTIPHLSAGKVCL
jgi:hypothetical protein